MTNRLPVAILTVWLTGWSALCPAAETIYLPMSAAEVKSRVLAWAEERQASAESLAAVNNIWSAVPVNDPGTLLEQAVRAISTVDPEFKPLLDLNQVRDPVRIADLSALTSRPVANRFVTTNLQAWLGRNLAEQRLYDEALQQLSAVDPHFAIDPAAVLFYRAVAAQETLAIPEALTSLAQLLDETEQVPARYATVAELMQLELESLQSQSLGEIARLMNDSERRLDLGRAGEQVQDVQERIVAGLDELIKKIEAQQGGGGGGGGGSNSNEPSSAAGDSQVKGAPAPGETDPKKFGKDGNWGDLPPKEQAAAKNLINRDFPSHYRQAIEMYFKKLAGRPAAPEK